MLHSILELEGVYSLFRNLTGAHRINKTFANEYICADSEMDILDVGCGPAAIVSYLKFRTYVGIDCNPRYLAAASKRFPNAIFLCEHLENLRETETRYDRILSLGVLHHIPDDSVCELLEKASRLLKPNGVFVSYDPCFSKGQHPLARLIHRLDRGRYVRWDRDLVRMAECHFGRVEWVVRHDLCRIPSSALVLSCHNDCRPMA